MNMIKVGEQIAALRKQKNMTQNDLGERIGVTFQSVSKWERGETLPDTAVLPDLARVLETTVDYILNGGEMMVEYKGRICVSDMMKGIKCLESMGEYLGRDNPIYRAAVNGINTAMNTNIEDAFNSDYAYEAFVAEAVIQNVMMGAYVDSTDVKKSFKHEHFKSIVLTHCAPYGIR